jgi:hypothetical protein
MRLDSSGNLGLGITPQTWNTGWNVFQIGSAGSIAAIKSTTGPSVTYSNNAYLTTGGAWNYITSSPTNAATQYEQYAGAHKWYYAASGTGAISWTQAMTLDSSGNVGIGTTSPTATLHVYQSASGSTAARLSHVNGNSIIVNPSYNYYDAYNHVFRSLNGTTTEMTLDNLGNLKLINSNNIASITQTAISLTGGSAGSPFVNGQSVNIITANSTTRGILIVGSTQNCSAMFFINAGGSPDLISQTTNETRFSITANAGNTANVFVSGTNIVLQNNIQASRDFYVTYIGQI